ncbi:MAG: DUF4407 domain-containing protein [Chlamydiales bacterium]|nr:DUF4407 domain-containing protein [Chlamydiales bacterium]
MIRIAPFPEQPHLRVEPEDLLDTVCERTSTVAKGALLLIAAAFTFCSGYSFFYTAYTDPSANALAVRALFFAGGTATCCIINSYLPSCNPNTTNA